MAANDITPTFDPFARGPSVGKGPSLATPWKVPVPRGHTLDDTVSDALTPIECAIERFLEFVAGRGIPVLALRGARAAPRYRQGGNLDLACPRVYRETVIRHLERSLKTFGVHVISVHRARHMDQYQLYSPCGPGRHHHLCIDIRVAETCYGVPFLDAEELLRGRNTERSPHRPAAAPGALINFLATYLSGGMIHPENVGRLAVVLEQYPAQLRSRLGHLVGTRMADRFCAALRERGYGALKACQRPFRRALLRRAFLRSPLATAAGFTSCVLQSRIASFRRTRGLTVGLLGTDGTGKTTVCEELHSELRGSFQSAWNRTIEMRPGLLPQLGRFFGRRPTEEEPTRPDRSTPPGIIGTWVRASYYWLDYTLGYAVKVLPLRRRNTLILFDRWIDDWLIDPTRYRLAANSRFVEWLVSHAPRPDVVLVTTATQKIVRHRKQEVSARESLRQLTAYEEYAASTPNAFLIDTSTSVDRSVDAAVLAVLARSQAYVPNRTVDLSGGPVHAVQRSELAA